MPKIDITNAPEVKQPTIIQVELTDASYPVFIECGCASAVGSMLRTQRCLGQARKLFIVTDDNVAPLYLDKVASSLQMAGYVVNHFIFPAGEESKTLDTATSIWNALAEKDYDRTCALVALGGGVVGDVCAFVASTYMRGVKVVQVPTTLLAMVDSSVGGKTAVNLPAGKNMVGTFWQPACVFVDPDVLTTLPEREWKSGVGEIAKMALISNDDFYFSLAENAARLISHDAEYVAQVIEFCVRAKAGVVASDEREKCGKRECLNLGHTFGHALEKVTGFGTYSHGECVAQGIAFAAEVAEAVVSPSEGFTDAQFELLDALGFEALDYAKLDIEEIITAIRRDKKNRGGQIRMVLVDDIGSYHLETVSEEILRKILGA